MSKLHQLIRIALISLLIPTLLITLTNTCHGDELNLIYRKHTDQDRMPENPEMHGKRPYINFLAMDYKSKYLEMFPYFYSDEASVKYVG